MSAAEPSSLFAFAIGAGFLLVGLLWQLFGLRKSNRRLKQSAQERELVIDTLRGTEARFYELTESSPVGIFFSDIEGRRIFANHKLRELSGEIHESNANNGWFDALHPDDLPLVQDAWQRTLANDDPFLLEYRFVLPSGETRWVLGQATAQKSEAGKIVGYMGTVTDITERKLSEQALQAHEGRLVEAQRIGNIGFWERDIASDGVIWSDEMFRIYGLEPNAKQLTPDEIFQRIHPEDQDLARSNFRECISTGNPFDLEHRIHQENGEERWIRVKAEVILDAGGKAIQFFGTAQDITETRQMQDALRQSEDRFQMTFDVGGAGMFIADSGGYFVRVNESFCSLIGFSEEELLTKNSVDVSHPDDSTLIPKLYRQVAYGELQGHSREKRFIHKDGHVVWAIVSGSAIRDSVEEEPHVFINVQNITDRKLAEQSQADGEARLVEAQRIANIGVWSRDLESEVIEWTDQVFRIFGLEPGSIDVTLPEARKLWHPDDVEMVQEALADVFRTGEKYDLDHRIVQPSGTIKIVHEQAELEYDEEGKPLRLFGTVQDVTELRSAESELQLSEERFRTAFNAGGAGMVISDHEGRYVEANRAFCDFVGYGLEELLELTSRDLTHPDDRPVYDELRDRLRSEDRVNIREKRYVRKDGETVWAITTGARVVDRRTGDVVVISNVQDITELKSAQESLAENEARFRGVFDLGAAGVMVVAPDGEILEANRAFSQFIGYSVEELGGMKAFNFMHPADQKSGAEDRKRLYAGEVERINVERRFFHRDGSMLWAQLGVSVMQIPGLDPVQVVMVQDITDRKADAEALARNTKLLDLVREVALAANQNIDFNDIVQFSLDRVCAFTGWPVGHAYVLPENEEDLLEPMRAWHLSDPNKFETFRARTESTAVDRNRQLVGEVLETGTLVWREQTPKDLDNVGPRGALLQGLGLKSGFATPVKVGDETVGVLEFFSDERTERDEELADALIQIGTELGRVFERQRADRALLAREEQLRQIIDNAPLWIYVRDQDGRYILANKVIADSLGVTTDALIGHKHEEFYDYPEQIELIRRTDREVIKSNRPQQFRDSKIWNSKGEERDMRIFKLPFTSHDGTKAVLGIGTDVTDEKKVESDLWRVQRMDALGHMTGGVAHDFNNLLTIILGNLQLLCRRIDDPNVLALAETAERAARRGGDVTSRLLAFARSQPLAPQATEISKLIDDTFPLLERSVGTGVQVEKRLARDLWWAQVDPGQLENALINLAVNARDAMPEGGRIAIKAENFRLKRRTRNQTVN
ncbi:MAG: PAS domain S-box protein [Alphaproteobacteria bacterium]|nr:PAS domain S-box protein [Alphaproteobacteria bacterium]